MIFAAVAFASVAAAQTASPVAARARRIIQAQIAWESDAPKSTDPRGVVRRRDGGLAGPAGFAIDSAGRVIVADSLKNRLRIFQRGGLWLADSAPIEGLLGVAVNSDGDVAALCRVKGGRELRFYDSKLIFKRAVALGADLKDADAIAANLEGGWILRADGKSSRGYSVDALGARARAAENFVCGGRAWLDGKNLQFPGKESATIESRGDLTLLGCDERQAIIYEKGNSMAQDALLGIELHPAAQTRRFPIPFGLSPFPGDSARGPAIDFAAARGGVLYARGNYGDYAFRVYKWDLVSP